MIAALLAAAFPMFEGEEARLLARVPPRVGAYVERAAECEHWAGEDAYDQARGREIARALRTLRCQRLGSNRQVLNRRYAHHPEALRALSLAPSAD